MKKIIKDKKDPPKINKTNPHLPDLAAAGREMLIKLVNTQPCLQQNFVN